MAREYIDPCPIHTLDEAVMWLSANGCQVTFYNGSVVARKVDDFAARKIGQGFDVRGTLMMATRGLWFELNGLIDEQPH